MANQPRCLARALEYADRGFRVLVLWWPTESGCACGNPTCSNNSKHPLAAVCPNGSHSATSDPAVLTEWLTAYPDANIGIATGQESGIWVLDVDPRHAGHLTLEALEYRCGPLPYSIRCKTGSGGWHIYFRHPMDGRLSNSSGRLGSGLDVRADGGYVVADPSRHASGGAYVWEDEDSSALEAAPSWLLELIGERYPDDVEPQADADDLPDDQAALVLRRKLAHGIKRIREGLSRHQTAVWLYQQLHDNRVPRRLAVETVDTLLDVANERPGDRTVPRSEFLKALTWAYRLRQRTPDPTPSTSRPLLEVAALTSEIERHRAIREVAAAEAVPVSAVRADVQRLRVAAAAPDPDDWRSRLIWRETETGRRLEHCLHNTMVILSHHESWRGCVRWNLLAERAEANGVPVAAGAGPWTDRHHAEAAAWLQAQCRLLVSPDVVASAIGSVAATVPYHPVLEYLDGLTWDQTPRLDEWIADLCGGDQTPYTAAVGRRWLVSAIARVRSPGCKADHVLILEGPQGVGKSRLLAALFTPWHTDEIDVLGSKDAAQQVRGVWCLELAELDSMHRSEVTRVKQFLSRAVDRYRPSYGREVHDYPRQCVFAGSTNREGYLQDETGARRFWAVRAPSPDPEGAATTRDQLWAEASVAYATGERWWLHEDHLLAAAAEEQDARYQTDSWEEKIESHLSTWPTSEPVTVAAILVSIGVETAKQGRTEQMRAAAILKRLGRVLTQKMVGGRKLRTWEARKPKRSGNE